MKNASEYYLKKYEKYNYIGWTTSDIKFRKEIFDKLFIYLKTIYY